MKKSIALLAIAALTAMLAFALAGCGSSAKAIDDPAEYITKHLSQKYSDLVIKDNFDDFYLTRGNKGTNFCIEDKEQISSGKHWLVYLEANGTTQDTFLGAITSAFKEDDGWKHGTMYNIKDEVREMIAAFDNNGSSGGWRYNPSTRQLVYETASQVSNKYYVYDYTVINDVDDPEK